MNYELFWCIIFAWVYVGFCFSIFFDSWDAKETISWMIFWPIMIILIIISKIIEFLHEKLL